MGRQEEGVRLSLRPFNTASQSARMALQGGRRSFSGRLFVGTVCDKAGQEPFDLSGQKPFDSPPRADGVSPTTCCLRGAGAPHPVLSGHKKRSNRSNDFIPPPHSASSSQLLNTCGSARYCPQPGTGCSAGTRRARVMGGIVPTLPRRGLASEFLASALDQVT
jgi:hypothetical protein